MNVIDGIDGLPYAVSVRSRIVPANRSPDELAGDLETVCSYLETAGQAEMAKTVSRTIASLRAQKPVEPPPGGVMTTGQAAKALGIRSINTVKRWVQENQLEGYRLGGRVMVSRRSVDHFIATAAVERQRDWEMRVDRALSPFDNGDLDEPSGETVWEGRRPWLHDGGNSDKAPQEDSATA